MTRGLHFERELVLLKLRVPEREQARLTALVAEFGGHVLSEVSSAVVIEYTGSEAQVSRFIAQASQLGELLEVVRSGALAVAQGRVTLLSTEPV